MTHPLAAEAAQALQGVTKLAADCELAAKVMAETGTFETGQAILKEAAAALTALSEQNASFWTANLRLQRERDALAAQVAELTRDRDEVLTNSERYKECIPQGYQPTHLRKYEARHPTVVHSVMGEVAGTRAADLIAWMTWWNCLDAQRYEFLRDDMQERLTAAEAKAVRLEGALSDPVAVHANILRGTIAKPTVEQIIHIYGADALRAALTEGDTNE
jgi:hypothetical protein